MMSGEINKPIELSMTFQKFLTDNATNDVPRSSTFKKHLIWLINMFIYFSPP
jgi:hypothetical protein